MLSLSHESFDLELEAEWRFGLIHERTISQHGDVWFVVCPPGQNFLSCSCPAHFERVAGFHIKEISFHGCHWRSQGNVTG
jgi:hypothetical protein